MMNLINSKTYSPILIVIALFFAIEAEAGFNHKKEKTITKEFAVNTNSIIDLEHERGAIDVIYYDGAMAKMEVKLTVEGDDEKDLETLLSKYVLDVSTDGDAIDITSGFDIVSWQEWSFFFWTKYKVEFKDGTEITTKVKASKSTLKLWIPKVSKLKLKTSYNNISTTDLPFSLEAVVFSANIKTGNLDGDLSLNLKYGDANIGNFKNGDIEIFTGNLYAGEGANVELNSKYSDLKFGNLDSLDLTIFEGKIKLKNVSKGFNIEGKYADISAGRTDRGEWDLFECEVDMDEVGDLELDEKYGEYNIRKIGNLELECFEGKFKFKSLGTLVSKQSKYNEIEIDYLETSLTSRHSFEEKIEIEALGDSFSGIEIDGKYGRLELENPKEYHLDFESNYGKFNIDTENLNIKKHIEKNNNLSLKASSKGAGEKAALIKVEGYEMTVDMK